MIRNAKAAGAGFVRRDLSRAQNRLFQADSSSVAREQQLSSVLNDGVIFDLDKPAATQLLEDNVEFLTLSLPDGSGETVDLELIRVDIFAPGFSLNTAAPTDESLKDALGVHYRGIIRGNERSLAAISIFKNEIMGFFSSEPGGNSVIGRFGGDNPFDTHIVYAERDLKVTNNFTCDTTDPQVPLPDSLLETPPELPGQCVRIYVEADFDLFQNKGSVTNTANYLTGLFNQSATLFSNDGLPVTLSEIFIWNIQSPYAGLTTSNDLLNKFGDVRTSFNGDFAHLVTLRNSGGRAWLNTFCSSARFRQAYSGIDPTFQNVPTWSWSVSVFTHELGHSMGSSHTHACVWNGNNTAIDGCGPAAGFGFEGSCSGAPVPSNGGTIMSYCHLSPNPGINFSLGFGLQPRNVIINRRDAATCLANCGGEPTPPNDNFANAQVISNSSGTASGTNIGATKESGEPNHAGNVGGKSVWYRWQAPGTGTVTITTAGSNFDTILGVYTGTSVSSLTLITSNDDDPNGGGLHSRVSFNSTSGTTYRIAVDGFNGASGNITLNWSLVAPPNPPGAQPATNVTSNSFTANWNSVSGATGYRIDVSTSSTFSTFVSGFQNLDVGSVLNRSVTGLSPGTTYHYRVRAYNANGTSGNSGTIQVTTNTANIQVTVQTSPSGRSFTVDGTTFTSAQTFTWTPGSSHTISTTSPQDGTAGTRFSWSNWSDGGAISHSVSPTSNTTFTANFTTQHFLTMNAGAGGTVSPPSGWFNSGQVVSISASPSSGFSFSGWTGSGSGSFTGSSNPANVTMNGPITETANFATSGPQAAYDATLKAPKCGQAGSSCDSGTLLNGRDTMTSGNEPNQPNTINNSCSDGNTGTYHIDESIDKVKVSTLDGSNFAPGKTAKIDVTLWAWTDPTRDHLDLYYAADATNPSWIYLTTLHPTVAGNQLLSTTYALPSGGNLQAVRARLRFEGVVSPCTGFSSFDDHDDLIFTTSTSAPAVNVALPAHGSVASASSTLLSNYQPSNAINGERAGANSTTGGVFNGWISNQSMPQWLQVDFGQVRSIHQIDVFMVQDNFQNPSPPTLNMTFTQFGLHGFEVQHWNGSSWVTITGGSVTGNNKVWKQFTFAAVSTSKIRVLTNASPDGYSRLTEVEAWSNTAQPPPVNVALPLHGSVASASSTLLSNYQPGNVINGERAGANSTTGGVFNGWISNQSMPQWLQVDFGQVRSIHQIDVFMVQDNYQNPSPPTQAMTFTLFGLHGFEVQHWNGSSWVTITGGSVTGNNKVWKQFSFPALSTSKIRVLTNASPDGYSRLTEVEAWSNSTPPPPVVNVAAASNGGIATASSTLLSNYLPGNVINGERAGANSSTGGVFNGWISTQSMPQWLQIDFGQVRSIHQIDVFMVQDNYQNPSPPTQDMTFTLFGLHGFDVQYWNGSSWVTIPGGNVTGNNKVWKQFIFPAVSTSRIRVLTNASPDVYSRLTEVEAWSNTSP